MIRHYNIPIFFPELACPFKCIYCNQAAISGQHQLPGDEEISVLIKRHLSTLPSGQKHVDIAFFGGNFTGLPLKLQQHYLELVMPFVYDGSVQGIRLSTRPDYINLQVLGLLSNYPVHAIELGAQSMDDEVLHKSGRGHSMLAVLQASDLILKHNIRLGLQMMTGLPGDGREKSIGTARKIIAAGAIETRIYPCLVIRETPLEALYYNGLYQPQSLDEAVELAADLYQIFNEAGVKVLRVGLHPSDDLNTGGFVAGPYHPSFNEMVMSHIWKKIFSEHRFHNHQNGLSLTVPARQLNHAVGFNAMNKKYLQQIYRKVQFKADASMPPFTFQAAYFSC